MKWIFALCLMTCAAQTVPIQPVSKAPYKGAVRVTWYPVDWGRPVTYLVGWSQTSGSYGTIIRTSDTNYVAKGLKYNTYYYFSVKTDDAAAGLQSPWAPAVRYYVRP